MEEEYDHEVICEKDEHGQPNPTSFTLKKILDHKYSRDQLKI